MTSVKLKLKKGDLVQVTTGKYKGKKGEILSVNRDKMRAVVKGVNVVTRHMRPSAANPEGKQVKELSIHLSNVAFVDPETNKPSRVGYRVNGEKRVRIAKKSGKEI
jgi:large subunit ribosomal protein L24